MIKKYKIKKFRPINKGFTLIETLVAISIFTMSILALLSLLAQGISDTNYAKKKIIAAYLAQEGVEYIRNMRDTFVLYDPIDSQNGWNGFSNKLISNSCQNNNGCYFDDQNLDYTAQDRPMVLGLAVTACGASCPPLLYDSSLGKYGYTMGVNPGFTRKIAISQISSNEIKIFSTVYWTQGSGNYSLVFSESLFNWIE